MGEAARPQRLVVVIPFRIPFSRASSRRATGGFFLGAPRWARPKKRVGNEFPTGHNQDILG